jgi:hypothetical protein
VLSIPHWPCSAQGAGSNAEDRLSLSCPDRQMPASGDQQLTAFLAERSFEPIRNARCNGSATPAQIVVGARHARQGGHKAFHRLGNAPADPNPSGDQNKPSNFGKGRSIQTQAWLDHVFILVGSFPPSLGLHRATKSTCSKGNDNLIRSTYQEFARKIRLPSPVTTAISRTRLWLA